MPLYSFTPERGQIVSFPVATHPLIAAIRALKPYEDKFVLVEDGPVQLVGPPDASGKNQPVTILNYPRSAFLRIGEGRPICMPGSRRLVVLAERNGDSPNKRVLRAFWWRPE